MRDPGGVLAKASSWSDTPRNRDAMSYGLLRYARRDSSAANSATSFTLAANRPVVSSVQENVFMPTVGSSRKLGL